MVRGVLVGMEYKVIVDNPSCSMLYENEIVKVTRVVSVDEDFESLEVVTRAGRRWYINNGQIDYYMPLNKGVV